MQEPAEPRDDLDQPAGFETLDGRYPEVAAHLGDALGPVRAFADLLVAQGVVRGLVGPREIPRLWERHVLNSAAVAPLLPRAGRLVDVGSGAGLPGIVLAAMRPDLEVVLVEPMERRVLWLSEVVGTLGLTSVRVERARAEELHGRLLADAVTARAVAPLGKLAGWTLPLLRQSGVLLAVKGRQAADELEAARAALHALGGDDGEVLDATTIPGVEGTTVVRVTRTAEAVPQGPARATTRTSRAGTVPPRRARTGRRR